MKKLLFSFLISLFLIPGVNAEECVNLFDNANANWYYWELASNARLRYSFDGATQSNISVTKGNTYTFWINDATKSIKDYLIFDDYSPSTKFKIYFDGNGNITLDNTSLQVNSYTFTTNSSSIPFNLYDGTTLSKLHTHINNKELEFWLVEGDKVCINSPSPEPEKPIIPDTTLDNFYSIYIEKLSDLSTFAIENKFVLSAISIILFFVCLGLFLHLLKRRTY